MSVERKIQLSNRFVGSLLAAYILKHVLATVVDIGPSTECHRRQDRQVKHLD